MSKCPWCGSTAQPEIVKEEYEQDGWTIKAIITYKCGCGTYFTGASWYHCTDCYEEIEPCMPPR